MDFTPIARLIFRKNALRPGSWEGREKDVQRLTLRKIIERGSACEFARNHGLSDLVGSPSFEEDFREAVEHHDYEAIREDVLKMTDGEPGVLWPGVCNDFAQSSGTSGGRSKFIPVTADSLRLNHYVGAADSVAYYLRMNPESRMFSGKGFILGGSFESQLKPKNPKAKVGDLSATLISKTPSLASIFRVPSKKIALLADWEVKLPALARAAVKSDITNLSGVSSWFMRVIMQILQDRGASCIREVWPNLEVFFHGGISFEPYRNEYTRLCGAEALTPGVGHEGMHYMETYNASEGFFAAQDTPGPGRRPLRLLLDAGIYYEFLPLGGSIPVGVEGVETGKVYELIITGTNGLWRYRLGDTVRIESKSPLRITLAGRTSSFINAFGEELMENNAETAVAKAAAATGAEVSNYTAAPVYSHNGKRGCHQWLIEWGTPPRSTEEFGDCLDKELRLVNSDYDAKRSHTIFLDPPQIVSAPKGLFDLWLTKAGSGKLGGQRKIPRLSNDRRIMDSMFSLIQDMQPAR